MTKWEQLEEWFYESMPNGGKFENADVIDRLGLSSGREATLYIQSHLRAQRAIQPRTLFVIHRDGRTSRAVWIVGVRTVDARGTSHQFFDDVQHRFVHALAPDLTQIAKLNPRAGRKCRQIIEAVGEGAMRLLQVAVDGIDADGDGDGVRA